MMLGVQCLGLFNDLSKLSFHEADRFLDELLSYKQWTFSLESGIIKFEENHRGAYNMFGDLNQDYAPNVKLFPSQSKHRW